MIIEILSKAAHQVQDKWGSSSIHTWPAISLIASGESWYVDVGSETPQEVKQATPEKVLLRWCGMRGEQRMIECSDLCLAITFLVDKSQPILAELITTFVVMLSLTYSKRHLLLKEWSLSKHMVLIYSSVTMKSHRRWRGSGVLVGAHLVGNH